MRRQIENLITLLAFKMDADKRFEKRLKIVVWLLIGTVGMTLMYKSFILALYLLLYHTFVFDCALIIFGVAFFGWLIYTDEKDRE